MDTAALSSVIAVVWRREGKAVAEAKPNQTVIQIDDLFLVPLHFSRLLVGFSFPCCSSASPRNPCITAALSIHVILFSPVFPGAHHLLLLSYFSFPCMRASAVPDAIIQTDIKNNNQLLPPCPHPKNRPFNRTDRPGSASATLQSPIIIIISLPARLGRGRVGGAGGRGGRGRRRRLALLAAAAGGGHGAEELAGRGAEGRGGRAAAPARAGDGVG